MFLKCNIKKNIDTYKTTHPWEFDNQRGSTPIDFQINPRSRQIFISHNLTKQYALLTSIWQREIHKKGYFSDLTELQVDALRCRS